MTVGKLDSKGIPGHPRDAEFQPLGWLCISETMDDADRRRSMSEHTPQNQSKRQVRNECNSKPPCPLRQITSTHAR